MGSFEVRKSDRPDLRAAVSKDEGPERKSDFPPRVLDMPMSVNPTLEASWFETRRFRDAPHHEDQSVALPAASARLQDDQRQSLAVWLMLPLGRAFSRLSWLVTSAPD
jgi:hypothetical protein